MKKVINRNFVTEKNIRQVTEEKKSTSKCRIKKLCYECSKV